MTYKKIIIYLKINEAKQTFANLPIIGCIYQGLFRLYSICVIFKELQEKIKSNNERNNTKNNHLFFCLFVYFL